MRLAFMILMITAMAVALVHLRRSEIAARHDIQRMESQRVRLRRQLWDAQVQLAEKLRPEVVRHRAERLALDVTAPHEERTVVAARSSRQP
ncbi:MAG: hypothetical protein ACOC93_05990 [Planctomycetota bacterium]